MRKEPGEGWDTSVLRGWDTYDKILIKRKNWSENIESERLYEKEWINK